VRALNSNSRSEELRRAAGKIFASALRAVDARLAIRRVVALDGSELIRIFDDSLDATDRKIYAVAIGKAGPAMAAGLAEILGARISRGVLTGPALQNNGILVPSIWQVFAGGHPLPNQQSLAAAEAALELLQRAQDERGLVIFLISGGGSAMIERPRDGRITLEDLREANRVLVSSSATIKEINAVRQAFSAIKGGGLSAAAPDADQITLIVSDTNAGDEASVASGPSLVQAGDSLSAKEVVRQYDLAYKLPESITEIIAADAAKQAPAPKGLRKHYVLLDNMTAVEAAATKARELGCEVEIAADLVEQPIAEGVGQLIARLKLIWQRRAYDRPVCLLSGGEFACSVRGNGLGGRNLETVLRCALDISTATESGWKHVVVLSAGTDGIDGNSPAAGAFADETTVSRAHSIGLNPLSFLKESDSFRLLQTLDDAIVTGATGTNVRDLRILLAC